MSIIDGKPETSSDDKLFCLNPQCEKDMDRVCKSHDAHFNNAECRRWMLSKKLYMNPAQKPIIHHQQGYFLNPQIDTLQTLLNLRSSSHYFQQRLKEILNQIRNSFQHTLLVIQNIVSMKISHILYPVDEFYKQIGVFLDKCSNLPSDIVSLKIQELIRSPNLKSFMKQQPMNLLKKLNIEQSIGKVKKYAEQMIDQLACSKQASSSDLLIGKSQTKELKKYLTDTNDDINRRTMKFVNLLKIPKRQLIIRDMNSKTLTLKCCFCPFNIQGQLKKKERDYYHSWVQLTDHLIGCHLEQVGYNYDLLISKKSNYETCLQNIMYLMSSYSYEGLDIIHSSGRRFYQFSYHNRKKLQVQIVLTNQLPQCNVRYIYINNMFEFCALVLMIASNLQKVDMISYGFGNMLVNKKKQLNIYISKVDSDKPRKLCQKFELLNVHFIDTSVQSTQCLKSAQDTNSYKCILEEEDFNNSFQI